MSSTYYGIAPGTSSENVSGKSKHQPDTTTNQNTMPSGSIYRVFNHFQFSKGKLTVHSYPEYSAEELEGFQVVNQQVSSVGNEILPDSSMDNNTLEGPSSQQRRSLELDAIPEGNSFIFCTSTVSSLMFSG
jgi:hypothetical protein